MGALVIVAAIEGAVIAALLIAVRRSRRARAAASRDLVEVATLLRAGVSREMGRLLASEVGTPLTSVLNNVCAARRLLLRDAPPLGDVRLAMDDAQLAGERVAHALQRLQADIPAGGAAELVELDEIAREGVRLVSSVGATEIATDLSAAPAIRGDRVELLQAIVDLLLHALVETSMAGRGRVRVRTRQDGDFAELALEYARGSVVEPDAARTLAGPLASGLAGLARDAAIAMPIVEAYGGTISAERAPHGERFATSRVVTVRVRFACASSRGVA